MIFRRRKMRWIRFHSKYTHALPPPLRYWLLVKLERRKKRLRHFQLLNALLRKEKSNAERERKKEFSNDDKAPLLFGLVHSPFFFPSFLGGVIVLPLEKLCMVQLYGSRFSSPVQFRATDESDSLNRSLLKFTARTGRS